MEDHAPIIVCGLTDGSIYAYQATPSGLHQKLYLPKVHGFGVNVLDTTVVATNPSKFVIVTGGDD